MNILVFCRQVRVEHDGQGVAALAWSFISRLVCQNIHPWKDCNIFVKVWAIMQNMIFDSVFEVDSVLENESDFFDSCRLHFEQKNLK